MTKKDEKEYQDEIRALNSVLLEFKDHSNALGHERDRWKELALILLKKLNISVPDDENPQALIENV